jgi:hypothetical protein
MPNIPVRSLGRGGIIRDIHPDALDPPAWSNGRNVLFENGKALRSPVWRTVFDGLGPSLKHCATLHQSSGYDRLAIARDDASLAVYSNGAFIEASEPGFTPRGSSPQPWSSCLLGEVLYINRPDGVPRAFLPGAATFTALPNWPSTWRATVLRQFQDQILALGITQGAVSLPSQINISDIAYFGHAPDSWDTTDPTKLAYSNDLAQLDGPILDGLTIGDRFLFYTAHQVWEMRAGGTFNYTFRKVFGEDTGVINTNCVVEAGGLHYVLGSSDIYRTDGNGKDSLADGRVREWIYRTMNKSQSGKFFGQYLPQTNEVMFAHVSGDQGTAWKSPTDCNNAWKYNISTNTWAPDDLPNVSHMALCNVDTVLTWAEARARGLTWAGVGGSWYSQRDSKAIHAVALSNPLSTPGSYSTIAGSGTLLGYDFIDRGQLTSEVDLTRCAPSFVERTGIALDGVESGQAPLNTAKTLRAIYPEVSISRPVAVNVQIGSAMTSSGSIQWEDPQTFDPVEDYQVDSRASGRYLAIRFTFDPLADTEIIGFDMDVTKNGSR